MAKGKDKPSKQTKKPKSLQSRRVRLIVSAGQGERQKGLVQKHRPYLLSGLVFLLPNPGSFSHSSVARLFTGIANSEEMNAGAA